ncbi:thioredoxin family protein [Sulfurivermis fontis]|uniref:thioredoxin family protein n=1 Tax=Sulfurivermis fontis TaxID=1972068 RepID=UPI000FD6FF72|nr:thioredoxin family protein [Sulfurivermis fontis]
MPVLTPLAGDFHHRLAETPGVSLVLFTGPACGACKRLKQVLREQRALFADVHLFEVDAGRDMALTREFGVFHLPALFLFRDGEYHCALHSEAQPEHLRAAIDAALARPAEEAP